MVEGLESEYKAETLAMHVANPSFIPEDPSYNPLRTGKGHASIAPLSTIRYDLKYVLPSDKVAKKMPWCSLIPVVPGKKV